MFRMKIKQIGKELGFTVKKHTAMALMTCLALTGLTGNVIPLTAYAAANTPEGCYKVVQSFKYNGVTVSEPNKIALTYKLTPITTSAPMPEGCDSEGYIFTMEGACEQPILPIEYDTPGVFVYELGCITEDVPDCEIDKRIYTIEEHVADDLQHSTIIYIEKGNKLAEISFAHMLFDDPEEPKNPNRPGPGGNNNSNERPSRPQPPNNQGNSGKTAVLSSPKTGDFDNPVLWITVVVASYTLLLLIIFAKRWAKEGRQKK